MTLQRTAITQSRGQAVRRRASGWAWWTAGLAFVAYPALRPWADASGVGTDALAAMATNRWVLAHLLGMLGFGLLPVGLAGLDPAGLAPRALRVARALAYAGVLGVLPYYGAESFGLHAVGRYAVATADPELARLVDGFRNGPVALTVFGLGLLCLAAAGVALLVAARGAGAARSLASAALALGLVLYLPQFFASPWLRIGHGVLVGAACWAVAVVLTTARQGSSTSLPRT